MANLPLSRHLTSCDRRFLHRRLRPQAVQGVTFWSVFYPWVFAYLGFYFLRGGSGMEGLLANMRDLIWIPITQVWVRAEVRGRGGCVERW